MRLQTGRPGVVVVTAKVDELAALVAGARIALRALESASGERTEVLARVLADFDRASRGLSPGSGPAERGAPSAGPGQGSAAT